MSRDEPLASDDPRAALTVGLFGYYSYRNLGDNLMAYLLAGHIKSLGHRPIVFSKFPADMESWGVDVISDPAAFISAADVIVFGGGGLLISRPHLNRDGADFNADLRQILEAANAKRVPLYGISIGGAGEPLHNIVPEERRTLIQSLRYVTLRNSEDLQLLKDAGVDGEFLDDLVWAIAARVPVTPPQRGNRKRVGINLYLGRSRRARVVQTLVALIIRLRPDIDFVFLDNQPAQDGAFQAYSPPLAPANTTRATLLDIEDACRALASLDVLFTSRLHVGVVAMSHGVTSVAFAGRPKTRLLYDRIGRSRLFWTGHDITKCLKVFLLPGGLDRLVALGREPIDPAVFDNADAHFARLAQLLAVESDRHMRMRGACWAARQKL